MKRDFIVSIRLDATMKKHIEEHAKRERRTVSDYLYLLLENEMLNSGEVVPCVFLPNEKEA